MWRKFVEIVANCAEFRRKRCQETRDFDFVSISRIFATFRRVFGGFLGGFRSVRLCVGKSRRIARNSHRSRARIHAASVSLRFRALLVRLNVFFAFFSPVFERAIESEVMSRKTVKIAVDCAKFRRERLPEPREFCSLSISRVFLNFTASFRDLSDVL